MRKIEMIMATTHLDRQGDKLTLEALEQMADHVKSYYIPLTVEHDPRIPPIGRVENAFIRQNIDGEYELVGNIVIFEPEDNFETYSSDKEIILDQTKNNTIKLKYDINYRNQIDNAIFCEIKEKTGIKNQYVAKKAYEPISVITVVAGTFIVGEIAKGFMSRFSNDTYEIFKKCLKKLLIHKKENEKEKLLSIELSVLKNKQRFLIEIICTNPDDQDIDNILEEHLSKLDFIIEKHLSTDIDIRKLVYEIKNGKLKIQFAIRKDCVPLSIDP